MRRATTTMALFAFVALTAAACSSSPAKHAVPPTTGSTGTVVPSSTSPPATSGVGATTAPPTSATGPGRCQPASLKGTFALLPGGMSAGHAEAQLTLTNTGTSACYMLGYVGMQLLGSSGQQLPTNVVRQTGAEQRVMLAPAASAVAFAQLSDVPTQGESQTQPCEPEATKTEVTPPDDTQFLVVPGPNYSVCDKGTIQIQPLQASPASGQ